MSTQTCVVNKFYSNNKKHAHTHIHMYIKSSEDCMSVKIELQLKPSFHRIERW